MAQVIIRHLDEDVKAALKRRASRHGWSMIILDANVLSALMQQQPNSVVVGWLDAQPAGSIWISGITLFEALHGLAWLPDGQRKAIPAG
jgi:hypothetical protein